MDNESSNRLEASDFWRLCNEFDTIDDSGSGSQHSDSCSSDPDGFVYPPSNHSSPTVVGVAVKRSLKVADDLNGPIHRHMNRMATPSGDSMDVMDVDGSAPIVDFDDVEEGVDVFYECNNNNAKNIAMNDAKIGGHVADLADTVDGRGPEQCGLDADSLTDLFLKKYHAHNELIVNNYYCINTKKIEETINLIDLNDDDAIRPVVIDTCGEAQVPALRVQQTESHQPHRTSDRHRGAGDVVDGNSTDRITKSGEQKTSPYIDSATLLNEFDSNLNGIVGSHLGDTVCTNHLLDNVREEIEKLKVNVDELDDEFQIANRINGTNVFDVLANCVANCAPADHNCYGRKESDRGQLGDSIINQCTTATAKRTRSNSDEVNDGANVDTADDTDGHGKIFIFIFYLYFCCCSCFHCVSK